MILIYPLLSRSLGKSFSHLYPHRGYPHILLQTPLVSWIPSDRENPSLTPNLKPLGCNLSSCLFVKACGGWFKNNLACSFFPSYLRYGTCFPMSCDSPGLVFKYNTLLGVKFHCETIRKISGKEEEQRVEVKGAH